MRLLIIGKSSVKPGPAHCDFGRFSHGKCFGIIEFRVNNVGVGYVSRYNHTKNEEIISANTLRAFVGFKLRPVYYSDIYIYMYIEAGKRNAIRVYLREQ